MNGSNTNTNNAPTLPSDVILTFLQEILEAWTKEQYQIVATKCQQLLKRKKTLKDLKLTLPIQRILLQAFIHQDAFDKVLEWSASQESDKAVNITTKNYNDLILYARYRAEDYSTVIKQIDSSPSSATMSTIQHHLKAQSHFHLDQPHQMSQTYQHNNMCMDDVGVLTNVMASIISLQCIPTVRYFNDDNQEESEQWFNQATTILSKQQHDDNDDTTTIDLAYNLGLFQFLTDPRSCSKNWLYMAQDLHDDDHDEDKNGDALQTTLTWSLHFWYKDLDDVQYVVPTGTNFDALSVPQSVAKCNQALLDETLTKLPSQPHTKWNRLQCQIYWYNRAILQLQAQQFIECRESCQSLRKATYTDMAMTKITSNNKKKKNKGSGGVGGGVSGGGGGGTTATTPTSPSSSSSSSSSNPLDLWWEARIDVVLAYVLLAQSKPNDASAKLDNRLETLKRAKSCFTIDHAMAHVMLHRHVVEQRGSSTNIKSKATSSSQSHLWKVLQSLPESIKACPAVQLTMDDLQSRVGNVSESRTPPKTIWEQADILYGQGRYEAACNMYKDALSDDNNNNNNNKDVETMMDSQLRYVQALAMTGQAEASQSLWKSLQSGLDDENITLPSSLPDGHVLEQKALPRTGSAGSTLHRNLIANGVIAEVKDPQADKRSRDKILRYRARKRDIYLKKLESKGLYNPDRPVDPNPERWIPKHERSRARSKGRNNNAVNRSAQGGGSLSDTQRLDAAARRTGKVQALTGPSSANIQVSTDGKKGGRRK
jgi:tetratricopeptide (TPR) repeat protein